MSESRKHRSRQACDTCRRKKVRCETTDDIPQDSCRECFSTNLKCTYDMTRKKRGPRYDHAFLRSKLAESAQALVSEILSPANPYVIPDDKDKIREVLVELASYIRNLEMELGRKATKSNVDSADSLAPRTGEPTQDSSTSDSSSPPKHICKLEDVNEVVALSSVLERMNLESDAVNSYGRHFGKSSNAMLIKMAMDMRGEMTGETHLAASIFQGFKRPEFWAIYPWQVDNLELIPYIFPEEDLLQDLVEIYFTKINIYMPLLHRPTFTKAVREGLHLRDHHFGELVLGLCALASRQSDDPRNASEGIDSKLSYGWKWFRQIKLVRQSFINKPSVYELQLYCLAALFFKSSSIPHGTWVLVGLGIRYAQEMGAHRRFPANEKPTAESELWKRAYWVLMTIDVLVALLFGRPRAIKADDSDLEYPLEVDDEYWEHPEHPFVQPPGKVSVISGWIHYLKLVEIMGHVHRGIYSIRRSPWNEFGIQANDPEYDQKTVIFLDSALNKWIDSMPEHVKWDQHQNQPSSNPIFFNQSVMLHSTYYWAQIQVHKSFIPQPSESGTKSRTTFPSLAICANAARSCVHIVESQIERIFVPIPLLLPIFLTTSIMLLLNIWRGKRVQAAMDPRKELVDVYRCLRIVKKYETNYEIAGRLYDMLHHLIVLTRMPLPQEVETEEAHRQNQPQSRQQPESLIDGTALLPNPSSFLIPQDQLMVPMIPSFDVSHAGLNATTSSNGNLTHIDGNELQAGPGSELGPFQQPFYTLPFHSNELGHLPVFETSGDLGVSGASTSTGAGNQPQNQRQDHFGFGDSDSEMINEVWRMMQEDEQMQTQWMFDNINGGGGSEHMGTGVGVAGSSGSESYFEGNTRFQVLGVPLEQVFFLNVGSENGNLGAQYAWDSSSN